jgi:hypothetical protein
VFIGLLRRPGTSRPGVEPEIERRLPSSENLTIGSASKMTGVDVQRPLADGVSGRRGKPDLMHLIFCTGID